MFSDPVVGQDFFGRQEIVDLIVKRASALRSGYRQNIAIIGHQQLGKTSILRQFLHTFRDPEILAIYVEIKLQALDFFVDQFVRSLLYQFLIQNTVVSPTTPLTELVSLASARLPKTVSRIEEIESLLKLKKAEEAYSKVFELTSIIHEETGKSCVVILDEFHRLGEFGVKNAFSDFGKRIMIQKHTMYLLSSSSFSASRKILAEKLALLFGNFERIYLEPFDFETAFNFIEKKMAPLKVSDNLKYFLVAFTDGHPFFLDSIVNRARELGFANKDEALSPEDVALAMQKLLFESQGVLNQYFMKLISPWTRASSKGCHLLILAELARGKNKLSEISLAIRRSQKETARQINELIENELLIKNGMFYRFHNKIFKFWLKEVYERKELSLLGMSDKAVDFYSRVRTLICEYEELLSTDKADRVRTLFAMFNNEFVEFGEKRRLLPQFTEFNDLESQGTGSESARRLIAKGHGRCWVCKIVEERASEKDVFEFVNEVTHEKSKTSSTKVLVALRGLDENAKLLAKDKKILTLGLSRINLLMDLYGHHPIICRPRSLAARDNEPLSR